MEIKKAVIENFKSISKVEVSFTHDCKVFVGLSESGKTNLLLALNALDKNFVLNKTFLKEGTINSEPAFIKFYLNFEKKEKEDANKVAFKDIYSSKNNIIILENGNSVPLEDFIKYEICYEVDIRSNTRWYEYFSYSESEKYLINPDYAFVNSNVWPIKIIDKSTQQQISISKKSIINIAEYEVPEKNIQNIENAEEVYDFLEEKFLEFAKSLKLPETIFWKYEENLVLPSEVPIISFASNSKANLPLYYIFKLSGIENIYEQYKESKDISETAFQNVLDNVSKKINTYLKKVWKSMPKVNIQLEEYIDKIRIRIVDSKNKYVLKNRSDGFKRLITFMIMISLKNENKLLNNNLILIDEPNSQIDIPGQMFLMKELVNIGRKNYVFYSTHSDTMIDTDCIERHYIVKKEKECTTIEMATEENYDNAAALYKALGRDVYKVINEKNLVFEGWTDTHLLNIVVSSNKDYKKKFEKIGKTHVGGAKKFKIFAKYWGLLSRKYFIIADNDDVANREKRIFEEEQYEGNWFSYADCVSSKVVTTAEDFLKNEYIKKIADEFSKEKSFKNEINLENLSDGTKMEAIKKWILFNISKEDVSKIENEFKKVLFNSLSINNVDIVLYNEFINNLLEKIEI